MTRPAKPPVRYAYAVCNARGKIAVSSMDGALAVYRTRRIAQQDCANGQHVERVRVSIQRSPTRRVK